MSANCPTARSTSTVLSATLLIAIASSPAAIAQQIGRPASNTTTTADAHVLEPGDVYLPGSRVYVSVAKTGFGHEHAVVGQLRSGRLQLDASQSAGQLVFDMRTFAADTEGARRFVGLPGATDTSTQQQVNANMWGPAVLDVARFPTATFQVRSVTRLPQPSSRGLPQYRLDGDFTLHGVTRSIQVVADVEEKDGWIHLRGGFPMLQSEFGITPFSKAFGAIGVADPLTVWGDLWLTKDRQTINQSTGR